MKQAQPAPRPRGRPPGSKNKPKPPELPLPKSKKTIADLPTEPAYEISHKAQDGSQGSTQGSTRGQGSTQGGTAQGSTQGSTQRQNQQHARLCPRLRSRQLLSPRQRPSPTTGTSQRAADAPVVSQDLSGLRPAAAAAEALARAGGGAGLRLARGAPASPGGAAAPGRCEPADGGRAPPGPSAALRARRAQGRRTCSGRSCRAVTLKEMKTLRAHGFSQRPRFEQVVGYLERNEPLPWTSRTARPPRSSRATSTWTTSCSPARTRSLCSILL